MSQNYKNQTSVLGYQSGIHRDLSLEGQINQMTHLNIISSMLINTGESKREKKAFD